MGLYRQYSGGLSRKQMFWVSWWLHLEVEEQAWRQCVGGMEEERVEGGSNVFVCYLPLFAEKKVCIFKQRAYKSSIWSCLY